MARAFPVNVWRVIRQASRRAEDAWPKNPTICADFEADDTGGVLGGLLAEEDEFDRRTLWRLAPGASARRPRWSLAVMANQSSLGMQARPGRRRRSHPAGAADPDVARETQSEARRLAAAIDTLNSDRDRLYTRVTGLEQGLDSVTGAIARQGSAGIAAGARRNRKPRQIRRPRRRRPVATAGHGAATNPRRRRAEPGRGLLRRQGCRRRRRGQSRERAERRQQRTAKAEAPRPNGQAELAKSSRQAGAGKAVRRPRR